MSQVKPAVKLEQLSPGTVLRGIVPDASVQVVNVQWFGSEALELTFKVARRQGGQPALVPG